ncbi:MAG: PQQ-dependent sugar dehydrogenase, partial [Candidatus Omnitrophica bacterium]|nr:PQQ-dependent sugar dehydrogenase [Candidatus Omnitrophota bacterium]
MKNLFSLFLLLISFFSLAPASAQDISLGLQFVAGGFSIPLLVTHAGDGSDRLFVVQQRGRIRILDANRNLLGTDFLNLGSTGLDRVSRSGSERGLLGLAFHPDYAQNGRFFVNYTLRSTNPNLDGDTIIAEYQVSPSDPNVALPTEKIILGPIDQPESNHNGGHLAFGPDGYLYIALGDGGGGGDPYNNGQNKNSLL